MGTYIRHGKCTLKDSSSTIIAICAMDNELGKFFTKSNIITSLATKGLDGLLWRLIWAY
jgi:hypothetical protein